MDNVELRVEPRITKHLFAKASRETIPLSGTFELSPVCNFSCRMCYVRKTAAEVQNSDRPIMKVEQWLEIARQARKEGMLYLLLTGGEPFLWPDFWELYEQLIQMGFLVSINTNGSMIDEAAIERLKNNPPIRVNITLYGASDESYEALCGVKGVFHQVDYAITELCRNGICVKLNGSLTPYNVGDLEACIEYAKAKGLIYETTAYMFPPIRRDSKMTGQNERFTPKEAARYNMQSYHLRFGEELYHKRVKAIANGAIPPPGLDESCLESVEGTIRCRAGKASFWITWDGWMTPCGMMPEPKIEVTNQSFAAAWKELTKVSHQLKVSGVCTECPNQKLCHSCAAMALTETGSTSGVPKYLCEMVQEMKRISLEELK